MVRLRTARASCILCRSPVERVEEARSRVRYPSPRSRSLLAAGLKRLADAFRHGTHFFREGSWAHLRYPFRKIRECHPAGVRQERFRCSLRRSGSFGQTCSPDSPGRCSCFRNFSTRFMPFSSLTFERAFSTV